MTQFNQSDLELFRSKGILPEKIEVQIKNFLKGFPYAELISPATPDNGITVLSEEKINEMIRQYDHMVTGKKVVKFVPASGAASRMFKKLFEYLERSEKDDQASLIAKETGFNSPKNFIENLRKFAFYDELVEAMKRDDLDLEKDVENNRFDRVISYLVNPNGLNYGNLPKGLLTFHKYPSENRIPLEEHLVEAAQYAVSGDNKAYIHFTVSPEHMNNFKSKLEEVVGRYESMFNLEFEVSFSVQKPSTDTIAVDMDNHPFREEDGMILFRPGGHGALIENLWDIDADLIFIKNIDNVVPDYLKDTTTRYKKAIGGLLLSLQEKLFKYLEILNGESLSEEGINEIKTFAEEELMVRLTEDFDSFDVNGKKDALLHLLNRPIRVCGMVKNEGEPGGGPFWLKNEEGQVSLQIVESSQINMKDEEQVKILKASTHFNPVDLVCGTKDYQGKRFNLKEFIDYRTGFISHKSKNGRDLKAQELPGLWNGAMAEWITLFVEVPVITFNPVKTVNDLLREQHQPE